VSIAFPFELSFEGGCGMIDGFTSSRALDVRWDGQGRLLLE
jgi:hypothetical protein